MSKRGRPEYKPSRATRHSVSVAAGGGVSHEEIALGLGISRTTLLKHFAYELTTGAYLRRREVMDAMHKAAINGNVAAQKAYAALTPKPAAPPPLSPDQPAAPEGKKAQAQADAITAHKGTDWAELLTGPAQ